MNNEAPISPETFFLACADKTRLRLLNLMRDGEVCVDSLSKILGESQPKISRHLASLRNAGIVAARREGKWSYYRIVFSANSPAGRILRETLAWLALQPSLLSEYEKYVGNGARQSGDIPDSSFDDLSANETYVSTNMSKDNQNRTRINQLETHLL